MEWIGRKGPNRTSSDSIGVESITHQGAAMAKYQYVWQMSDDCRRSKWTKETFLEWMRQTYSDSRHPPTPAEVVKEARKKSCPIHNLFEWDVNKAARQAWLAEAGYLLRHLHVVKVEVKTRVICGGPVRAFIPLEVGRYGRIDPDKYEKAQRVMAVPRHARSVVDRAYEDLIIWYKRYERYQEFLEVYGAVIKALKTIDPTEKEAG